MKTLSQRRQKICALCVCCEETHCIHGFSAMCPLEECSSLSLSLCQFRYEAADTDK